MHQLEKFDLHAHFNGCIPTSTVLKLIKCYEVAIPEGFDLASDLQVLKPVDGLSSYFKPWRILKRLPRGRTCLDEMILAACAALSDDNVRYAELRNSPFNIPLINDIPLEEAVEWLSGSLSDASSKTGIDCRWVLSLTRHNLEEGHGEDLLRAIRSVGDYSRIVGIDMSGKEDCTLSQALKGKIASMFRNAKDELGLGITIHAGETGDAQNVKWAIVECAADRIGHGLAIENSPALIELVLESDTCIEVCLTSNLRSGVVKSLEDHPVLKFIENGVPFVLCSDNPQIHSSSLSEEYTLFTNTFGHQEVIDSMLSRQRRYAFHNNNRSR